MGRVRCVADDVGAARERTSADQRQNHFRTRRLLLGDGSRRQQSNPDRESVRGRPLPRQQSRSRLVARWYTDRVHQRYPHHAPREYLRHECRRFQPRPARRCHRRSRAGMVAGRHEDRVDLESGRHCRIDLHDRCGRHESAEGHQFPARERWTARVVTRRDSDCFFDE